MSPTNTMLWTLTDITQDKDGASTAVSSVSVLEDGSFKPIPTPARDTVIADGKQTVIYTISAPGWEFTPWHGDQKAPDGKESAYPGTPLLMSENDQVTVVSWSPTTMILQDMNTDRSVYPFFASLDNPDKIGSEDDYWDPQIVNDGSGRD